MKFRRTKVGRGKAPGDFKRARARHLAQQRRRDAISALRRGETIWVTVLDGDTGKLTRCEVVPDPGALSSGKVLCFVAGTLRAAYVIEKHGIMAWVERRTIRISLDRIYGRVLQQHPRLRDRSAT